MSTEVTVPPLMWTVPHWNRLSLIKADRPSLKWTVHSLYGGGLALTVVEHPFTVVDHILTHNGPSPIFYTQNYWTILISYTQTNWTIPYILYSDLVDCPYIFYSDLVDCPLYLILRLSRPSPISYNQIKWTSLYILFSDLVDFPLYPILRHSVPSLISYTQT